MNKHFRPGNLLFDVAFLALHISIGRTEMAVGQNEKSEQSYFKREEFT